MMQIRIVKRGTVAVDNFTYGARVGDILTVTDAEGQRAIGAGIAEAIREDKAPHTTAATKAPEAT